MFLYIKRELSLLVVVVVIDSLKKYDKTVRRGLFKVCNVNVVDISSTQLALPAQIRSLGDSSASLSTLPAFLGVAGGRSFLADRTEVELFDRIAGIEWSAVEFDRSRRVENVLCLPQSD